MAGIGVVINPHAGRNLAARARAGRLTRILGEAGVVHETQTLAEVDASVQDFRRRGIDLLAICGGDGSFFRTLSALVRVYGNTPLPSFLPLRAGSMNTIAGSVGWRRGAPEEVLTAAVASYRAGRSFLLTQRDLIRVNDEQYGFMVGAGVVVEFLQAYYARRHKGKRAAAQLLVRLVTSYLTGSAFSRNLLASRRVAIVCDGARVPQSSFTFLYASTLTDIGFGFRPAYRATSRPGSFQLLGGPISLGRVLPRLRRLWRGRPLELPELHDALVQRATVEFPHPTHYMVDGDVLPAVPAIELVTGPRLTIVAGIGDR